MTDIDAAKIIALLQVAYPFPPLTDERHQFYTAKLRPLDFAAATKAVDVLTDDPSIERFPTAAQLRMAVAKETRLPALPPGNPAGQPTKYCRRVWDIDADDYVELDEPIPDTDPRYAVEIAASRERVKESGRRDASRREGAA